MFQLNAIGAQGCDRWTKSITPGKVIRLGRAPVQGWSVPWDMRISREHCEIELKNERLYVRCLENARNPIYRLGEAADQFTVFSGETFRIGLTTFRFDLIKADQGSDSEFDVSEDAVPAEMVETDRVDGEVEHLRDEIASLRAQLQADAETKRDAAQRGRRAQKEINALRHQLDELKEELSAAQLEIERMQMQNDKDISDSKEFKALQANVELLKEKVQSGEFLSVSAEGDEDDEDADIPSAGKEAVPKGFEPVRTRVSREGNTRNERGRG